MLPPPPVALPLPPAAPGWLGVELLHAATPARTGTLRAARPRKSRRDIPFDSTLISVLARRGLAAVVGLWSADERVVDRAKLNVSAR